MPAPAPSPPRVPSNSAAFYELMGDALDTLPPHLSTAEVDQLLQHQHPPSNWQQMWSALDLPPHSANAVLDRHWHRLQRRIRDDDVSYNTAVPEGPAQREWALELLPVLLQASEWQGLERGILQRVRVLNAMLRDLYGERTLLTSGLVPPALVLGHPDYLPSMHRVYPPHGTYLHLAAFDVIRLANGRWNLLSQRLQAPSGMGYLLENRHAVQQQLPKAFDTLRVRRLSNAYRTLIEGLRAHCPEGPNARIALLTSGPHNETYFEHVYLARYLGITLVEGSDLTVRGQRLYLKTMHGLTPVHALIKRMDDQYLDPLELRPDSQLGVPGLLQTLRAGNLLMANWPGTGFMESSALLGFLPALSKHLLGEQLELPAAPTWWCGEAAVRQQALGLLDDCVIKPTYPKPYPGVAARHHFDPVLTRWLNEAERERWAKDIQRHSDEYTVQAHQLASLQPVWQPSPATPLPQGHAATGMLSHRPLVLRLFAFSTGPDNWQVLPGGMARLPLGPDKLADMRLGGSTADVWVMASSVGSPMCAATAIAPTDAPASAAPLSTQQSRATSTPHSDAGAEAPPAPPMPAQSTVTRRVRMVTTHSAENLFWLGRYTERAENLTRLLALILDTIGGEQHNAAPLMNWLDRLSRELELVLPDTPNLFEQPFAFAQALAAQMPPGSRLYSVGSTLLSMHTAATGVRDRWGPDHWRAMRMANSDFAAASQAALAAEPSQQLESLSHALSELRTRMAAIAGLQMDHMTRDDGWRLLALGRGLERMAFHSQALSSAFHTHAVHDFDGYDAVLKLFDSTISFHALYQQTQSVASLLDLLLLSTENPRSLGYIDQYVRNLLHSLRRHAPEGAPDLTLHLPRPAQASLAMLCATDEVGNFHHLHTLLDRCTQAACELSNQIAQQHFTLYQEARQSVWT